MNFSSKGFKFIFFVLLLTGFLTWFFFVHENLPKPLRALSALIETPVAIASGISHYLNLGIPVYETTWAIISVNLVFSILLVYLVQIILKKRNSGRTTKEI